jgi:hypothetical protein
VQRYRGKRQLSSENKDDFQQNHAQPKDASTSAPTPPYCHPLPIAIQAVTAVRAHVGCNSSGRGTLPFDNRYEPAANVIERIIKHTMRGVSTTTVAHPLSVYDRALSLAACNDSSPGWSIEQQASHRTSLVFYHCYFSAPCSVSSCRLQSGSSALFCVLRLAFEDLVQENTNSNTRPTFSPITKAFVPSPLSHLSRRPHDHSRTIILETQPRTTCASHCHFLDQPTTIREAR